MKAYKFRIYPTKSQDIEMRKHLWLAKELWNDLLECSKRMCKDFVMFPARNTLQRMVKNAGLYSQTQQEIAHRPDDAVKRSLKLRKAGKKVAFPRFKSFDRMKSIHYPQSGFSLGEQLSVTPFGDSKLVQHRAVEGQIKTLSLKRESAGKWHAVFTIQEPAKEPVVNAGSEVGVDVGLKCFARLSNGETVPNPRHPRRYEEKLARAQRRLSKKQRASLNRKKARRAVAIVHERIRNVRNDFLHKTSTMLVKRYSLIALEKLDVRDLMGHGLGKSNGDAGWATFASMLCYKAENAGSKIVFVNPAGTTRTCHRCGSVQDMPLPARTYAYPRCGLSEDRDLNASKNILIRATLGHSGSNASGDGPVAPSLSEEAPPFRGGSVSQCGVTVRYPDY
jgi:putative transposase